MNEGTTNNKQYYVIYTIVWILRIISLVSVLYA